MEEKKQHNYFIGDSHIARWDLNTSFPLTENFNLGVGGEVIEGVSRRIKKIPISPGIQTNCFILVGTNNCISMISSEAERDSIIKEMVLEYRTLFDSIPAGFSQVIVLGIFPTKKGFYPEKDEWVPELYRAVNDSLKAMAVRYPRTVFIDTGGPLTDKEFYLKPDYTLDGLHLNGEGYHLLTQIVRQQMN